nr:MFS transporter [Nocardia yunnanensis]
MPHALRRGEAALIDLRLLRDRNFAAVNAMVFVYIGMLSGLTALLPLYFQTIGGDSPLRSGALVAPLGVGAIVTTVITGRLGDTYSPRPLILAGLPVALLGILGLAEISPGTADILTLSAIFVIGLGHCMIMPAALGATYRTLPRAHIASATTATNVGIRAGSSFGVAAVLILLQRDLDHRSPAYAFAHTYWWTLAIATAAIVPALLLPRRV